MNAFSTVADYYEVLTNSASRLAKEGPLLLRYLEKAEHQRVLDIACGTGLHALFLAENGAVVTAVDLSLEMTGLRANSSKPSADKICLCRYARFA